MKLSELVAAEGFGFVVVYNPALLDTVCGNPQSSADCCAQKNNSGDFIACVADTMDHAYGASHEIAESKYDFKHSFEMFSHQCAILARWCKMLDKENHAG